MKDETVTIVGWVRTNKVGSKCEFEVEYLRDEWDSLTDVEREQEMLDAMWDSGQMEWSYEER